MYHTNALIWVFLVLSESSNHWDHNTCLPISVCYHRHFFAGLTVIPNKIIGYQSCVSYFSKAAFRVIFLNFVRDCELTSFILLDNVTLTYVLNPYSDFGRKFSILGSKFKYQKRFKIKHTT